MTLVVCRLSEDKSNIYIHSDSRITEQYSIGLERELSHNSPLCGMLKSLIINPLICISFAGNADIAASAMKTAVDQNEWKIGPLLKFLLDVHLQSAQKTDFIATSAIDGNIRIDRISNGGLEETLENAWIGDKDAFEFYQKCLSQSEPEQALWQQMHTAFRAVIDEPSITSVGDFHISTSLDHKICPNALSFFMI